MWHNTAEIWSLQWLSGWDSAGAGEVVAVQGQSPASPCRDVSLVDFFAGEEIFLLLQFVVFCASYWFVWRFDTHRSGDVPPGRCTAPLHFPRQLCFPEMGRFWYPAVLSGVTWFCSQGPQTPPTTHSLATISLLCWRLPSARHGHFSHPVTTSLWEATGFSVEISDAIMLNNSKVPAKSVVYFAINTCL